MRSGAPHNLRLFGEPVDDVLEGLSRRHPVLYEGLVTPGALSYRDVRTLEELSRLEVALADAGSVLDFFEGQLGFSPEALMGASFGDLPEAERDGITFSTLFRTGLAQSMLSDTFSFQPLSREELAAFLNIGFDLSSGHVTATDALNVVLAPLKEQVDALMSDWIDDQVSELGLALGRVQAYDLDPAFASALILTVGD